jgi:hypothetical protein
VSHDKLNKTIIPIGEFISTAHDTQTISNFLLSIKFNIQNSEADSSIRVVVTDFSWVLMKSIILIFNGCNIITYLHRCYDHLYGLENNIITIKTIHIHCSVHTLKNVIRKAKKTIATPQARKVFIFCFSLLQSCVQTAEFEAVLINIYNLFNQKYETKSTLSSLAYLI